VLEDTASGSKKGIVSDWLYARTVLLDPCLTVTLPSYYTAITGLDAFVHAMESFVNLTATPFTDALNRESMRIIAANIRKAYANGADIRAREQMLYAAALSGMGFSNTQNGVIHALGMAVPTKYRLPHGLLMAAIAPMGIAFNVPASPEKYAEVATILGSAPVGANTQARAKSAAQGFAALLDDLGIKAGLQAHGVPQHELVGIAERAAASARLMANNPRKGSAKELLALLQQNF
jgi:alcohol dehydrogenase